MEIISVEDDAVWKGESQRGISSRDWLVRRRQNLVSCQSEPDENLEFAFAGLADAKLKIAGFQFVA